MDTFLQLGLFYLNVTFAKTKAECNIYPQLWQSAALANSWYKNPTQVFHHQPLCNDMSFNPLLCTGFKVLSVMISRQQSKSESAVFYKLESVTPKRKNSGLSDTFSEHWFTSKKHKSQPVHFWDNWSPILCLQRWKSAFSLWTVVRLKGWKRKWGDAFINVWTW